MQNEIHPAFKILNFAFKSAHLAQLVEHTLGKGEVTSSILVVGFKHCALLIA